MCLGNIKAAEQLQATALIKAWILGFSPKKMYDFGCKEGKNSTNVQWQRNLTKHLIPHSTSERLFCLLNTLIILFHENTRNSCHREDVRSGMGGYLLSTNTLGTVDHLKWKLTAGEHLSMRLSKCVSSPINALGNLVLNTHIIKLWKDSSAYLDQSLTKETWTTWNKTCSTRASIFQKVV